MSRFIQLLGGMGFGSGLMYLFDPDVGRRRRALVRDQVVRGARGLQTAADKGLRDFENRAQGFAAELRRAFTDHSAPDDVLEARIRAKLGRYVSHPRAIEVYADEGHVILCGPILEGEVKAMITAIRSVAGVRSVENNLQIHRNAIDEPALQGGSVPPGERWNIAEENLAPGTRLSLTALGGGLVAYGLMRRFPLSCVLGTIGLGTCLIAAVGRSGEQRRPGSRAQPKGAKAPQNPPGLRLGIPPSHDTAHELERAGRLP